MGQVSDSAAELVCRTSRRPLGRAHIAGALGGLVSRCSLYAQGLGVVFCSLQLFGLCCVQGPNGRQFLPARCGGHVHRCRFRALGAGHQAHLVGLGLAQCRQGTGRRSLVALGLRSLQAGLLLGLCCDQVLALQLNFRLLNLQACFDRFGLGVHRLGELAEVDSGHRGCLGYPFDAIGRSLGASAKPPRLVVCSVLCRGQLRNSILSLLGIRAQGRDSVASAFAGRFQPVNPCTCSGRGLRKVFGAFVDVLQIARELAHAFALQADFEVNLVVVCHGGDCDRGLSKKGPRAAFLCGGRPLANVRLTRRERGSTCSGPPRSWWGPSAPCLRHRGR